MKKFLMSLFLILTTSSFANSYHHIKLAIFDNPQADPSRIETSQKLVASYRAGINTAIAAAAGQGIKIEEKEFLHDNSMLNIIQQAANVKAWGPDVIMGFNTSNEFLMAKSFFGDQLSLSISATAPEVLNLPSGFYTLGMPDSDEGKTIMRFINERYPNTNLFITIAAESKESVNFADLLAKNYKTEHPKQRIIERKFLTDDMNSLNLSKFMEGYQPGDVIVVMSIGYYSGIDLMNKIANYLKPENPIFITSSDNWGSDDTPQIINGFYNAFRIDTLLDGKDTKEYKKFSEDFKKVYHTEPTDTISFVTYRAVMSFVTALEKYPPPPNLTTAQAVLWSYKQALKHNSNWFRPTKCIVYKIEPLKELYLESLDLT